MWISDELPNFCEGVMRGKSPTGLSWSFICVYPPLHKTFSIMPLNGIRVVVPDSTRTQEPVCRTYRRHTGNTGGLPESRPLLRLPQPDTLGTVGPTSWPVLTGGRLTPASRTCHPHARYSLAGCDGAEPTIASLVPLTRTCHPHAGCSLAGCGGAEPTIASSGPISGGRTTPATWWTLAETISQLVLAGDRCRKFDSNKRELMTAIDGSCYTVRCDRLLVSWFRS